ncbi:transcriptional regulator, TetR family [Microbacterium sp. cf046]|uniref:TetR/AcrR family transcriptional regulator n=1 Tax=Microbacterium sp. cf046 TaxID=1761803 RepID=UPI0008DF9BF6|nr:TetR/AcrR family transcriptional regulator [Microbacterium sp. cf046]SFR92135.1 transcriptional regulator, TetR family [Microbacterium sp. cf046]
MTSPEEASLIWLRPEPSGRKPRYTREQIARTALAIADAEGFDAVTMKRIAAELGSATMTLYYYVRTKADIIALMHDAILEEVLIPADELPEDWREATAEISRRSRSALIAHPWSPASLNDVQFGPNAMRHYEQSLAALRGTTLTTAQKITLTGILDDYVIGSALHTIETMGRARAAELNPAAVTEAIAFGTSLLSSGDFPEMSALSASMGERSDDDPPADGPAMGEDMLGVQFETGLNALLDGLSRSMGIRSGARLPRQPGPSGLARS